MHTKNLTKQVSVIADSDLSIKNKNVKMFDYVMQYHKP